MREEEGEERVVKGGGEEVEESLRETKIERRVESVVIWY